MPSRYSVIQYVPDPVKDERINIGIVAFDEVQCRVAFLERWERVKRFAVEDIEFLKEFAEETEQAVQALGQLDGIGGVAPLTPERIMKMSDGWMNSIQLTEPRSSLNTVGETFEFALNRFLVDRSRVHRDYRNRIKAAAIARSIMREALKDRIGLENAELYLQSDKLVQGQRKSHMFDGVVANGDLYYAVHGISFELPEARQLDLHVDALAWAVADIRERHRDLPIGIMTLAPKPNATPRTRQLYKESIPMYRGLGASILNETNVEKWSREMAERVPNQK